MLDLINLLILIITFAVSVAPSNSNLGGDGLAVKLVVNNSV